MITGRNEEWQPVPTQLKVVHHKGPAPLVANVITEIPREPQSVGKVLFKLAARDVMHSLHSQLGGVEEDAGGLGQQRNV